METKVSDRIKESEQETQTNGGCPNGQYCGEFKRVPETELLGYLVEGCQIVHRMANGEVILKR